MGRITNLEALKTSPLKEVWAPTKPPKYDLSSTLSQASKGVSP
jgi:hypothetical protein